MSNKQNITRKKKIASIITIWLIVIVMAACAVSAALTYFTLLGRSERQTVALVRQNVEDVSKDISEMADESILLYANEFTAGYIRSAVIDDPDSLSKELHETYYDYGVEVNVVNTDGIIVASSVPEYIGFDMHSGEQAAEFLTLLDGSTNVYVQDLRGISYDASREMKYAGVRFEDGSGFLQIGLTREVYSDQVSLQAKYSATNRRISEKGYLLICGSDMKIMNSYHNMYTGKHIADAGIVLEESETDNLAGEKTNVFGVPSYTVTNFVKGIYVIGVYPVSEAIASVSTMMSTSLLLELFVFTILFIALVVLIRKRIVKNIVRVNNALADITEGNLEERVDVRDTYEFDELSDDINMTVDRLKDYIAEAAARIDADLAVAKAIQSSAVPSVFPPFPERKEFELYAAMNTAKEVGGDFYDFYMLKEDTLGFLIADVSGKSIPGAMFMMTAKTVIKSLAESGLPPAEVFTIANAKLCEGNDAEMFVTAWMGYLDLKTGLVRVANAGHNPPLLISDGKAEYVSLRPGFVLAGMDSVRYREQSVQMKKGDFLFLYTDGVTEAMNKNKELYGEERLKNLLSFGEHFPAPTPDNGITEAVCKTVNADIEAFVSGAEQSDDITVMCIRYLGEP